MVENLLPSLASIGLTIDPDKDVQRQLQSLLK